MEQRETFAAPSVGRNVSWCSRDGNQYGDSSKNLKENYHMIRESYSWAYNWTNHNSKTCIHPCVYSNTIHNSHDTEMT